MRRYDPYPTYAKFDSYCSFCGSRIKKHDPIICDNYHKLAYCDPCGAPILRDIRMGKALDEYGTDIF